METAVVFFRLRLSGPSVVGELPDDTNESVCEDIITSSWKKDAFESDWEGLRWFLPLQAVSLLSKVSTVAFSLARLSGR